MGANTQTGEETLNEHPLICTPDRRELYLLYNCLISCNMLVVDASAVLAVVLNEPEKARLIALTKGEQFIAPASLRWEVGNALSAGLKRKRLTLVQAKKAQSVYRTIAIAYKDLPLEAALAIANQLNIYAYDAYMLTCAQRYQCPLLTLDKGLQYAAQQAGVTCVKVYS